MTSEIIEEVLCHGCSASVPPEDAVTINGELYCESCADEFCTCDDCGSVLHQDEMNDIGGRYVCNRCFGSYTRCHDCDEFTHDDYILLTGHGYYICRDCADSYITCHECGDLIYGDDSTTDENGYSFCEACTERVLTWCDECDQYERNPCSESSRGIHDYNFKPRPKFFGSGPLYLGVELEVECKNGVSSVYDAADTHNDGQFYCKHDGSLSKGFEFVSHPCSLDYHKKSFKWKDILSSALNADARSHDTSTCGLHVHMSRKFFNKVDTAKLVLFFGRCEHYITNIARRDSTRWSKYVKKSRKIMDMTYAQGRYEAVNLTNDKTIEIRVFRGTLKYLTFMASLEFCDAVARYVKTTGVAFIDTAPVDTLWMSFKSFVLSSPYHYLPIYMKRRGC